MFCRLLLLAALLVINEVDALLPSQRASSSPRLIHPRFATTSAQDNDDDDNDDNDRSILSPTTRKLIFGGAFVGENVVSYTGPGSDGTPFPQADLDLILHNLLNPQVMAHPPDGYGLFSYLLFNSFLYLPLVWGAIVLPQTNKDQYLPAWPFVVAASTALGGIGLYPYLALRQTTHETPTAEEESMIVSFFRGGLPLKVLLVAINLYVLQVFLQPFLANGSNLVDEVQGLLHMVTTFQFSCTTAIDMVVVSLLLLDPIADDAKRRGVLDTSATLPQALSELWPFLIPVFGALGWVLTRPEEESEFWKSKIEAR